MTQRATAAPQPPNVSQNAPIASARGLRKSMRAYLNKPC
jgi:hypothetical protein